MLTEPKLKGECVYYDVMRGSNKESVRIPAMYVNGEYDIKHFKRKMRVEGMKIPVVATIVRRKLEAQ